MHSKNEPFPNIEFWNIFKNESTLIRLAEISSELREFSISSEHCPYNTDKNSVSFAIAILLRWSIIDFSNKHSCACACKYKSNIKGTRSLARIKKIYRAYFYSNTRSEIKIEKYACKYKSNSTPFINFLYSNLSQIKKLSSYQEDVKVECKDWSFKVSNSIFIRTEFVTQCLHWPSCTLKMRKCIFYALKNC